VKINFSKQAACAARDLQPKPARQIAARIAKLAVDPRPQDSKKLHGLDCLRVDSGEYRILYWLGEEEGEVVLNIEAIGKRNDNEVYRKQKRKQ